MRPAFADLPPLIKREILFGNPEKVNPQISPDGKYVTYIAPDKNDILQVWIRTLGKQDDRMLTADKKRGIRRYFWTYDGKQLIYLQDINGNENYNLYAVNVNTKEVRNLTPYKNIQARTIALDHKFPNQILVGLNIDDPRRHDAYRIDLKTGKATLEMKNSGTVVQKVADPQLKIRATVATTPDGGSTLSTRTNTSEPWKIVRKWGPDEEGGAVSFSQDGKTLYIRSNHNANASRLLALDVASGKEKVIAQDPQYDLAGTLIHPTNQEIQAVGFYKDKLEWQVLDNNIATDFQALSKVRRGQFSIVGRDLADKTWLVAYLTDDGPVYYYKYNRDTKQSKLLFSNQPELEKLQLAQIKPISYKSRDGLTINGYLTTPVGIPAKNLPTILLVHGGPWARDIWGYDPIVQWLANRGYAVLQVNFRGSAGYGKKFLNAGNREWGAKMHDDLIDGVNWIVKQGIADPKKVAIMGGSYGGYASLAGVTFTPDVFAAAVSIVGPSNLVTLMENIPPYWEPIRALLYNRVGNPKTEIEFLKSRSPLFFVDRIQTPLLIGQGANDPRVKQVESEQIVNAMRKANKPVEYILYTDEGHSFVRPENRLHFFAKTEEFLGKYLGGRVEPVGNIPGHSGVVK
ncbi:peptidase S9 [Mastigocoleus testarum BC008]|uniref:Peptidase S9 n=1 Tax=Mastigocoleus testarum BC008 TaxID=371196 RepID=A0A0V7ZXH0_9CYAN|nr:peptidase S9 [Mastigocoleus testarum BC008]